MKLTKKFACVCTGLQYILFHLSLLQRLAGSGLVGFGRASLRVGSLEVGGGKSGWVVDGRVERE